MSDTPRQNAHASRLARRQSPYTRPAQESSAAPSTPSRLRSLLSYVSPFRSGRKTKVEAAPATESESEERQADGVTGSPSPEFETSENNYSAGSRPGSAAAQSGDLAFSGTGTSASTNSFQAPTAFTPHFRPDRPASNARDDLSTRDSPSAALAGPVVRRKRPLYVGAGYTGRRKWTGRPKQAEEVPETDVTAPPIPGKRRRLASDDAEGAPPTRSQGTFASTSSEGRINTANRNLAGPAYESASLSSSLAINAAQEATPPKRNATRAADLVMDILRSEMPQGADLANAPRQEQNVTRILNPYDTDENVLSLAASSTRTASSARKASRADVSQKAPAAANSPKQAEEPRQVKEAKEPSASELLQRTMPAAYRRETLQQQRAQRENLGTPSKTTLPNAEQRPAVVEKPKRQAEVVEILSSDEDTPRAESASEASETEGEDDRSMAAVESSERSDASGDASDEEFDDNSASEDAEVMVIDSDEESEAASEPEHPQPNRKPQAAKVQPWGTTSSASRASPASDSSSGRPAPTPRAGGSESASPSVAFGAASTHDPDTSTGRAEAPAAAAASQGLGADGAALATTPAAARDAALNQSRASLPLARFDFAQVLLHAARAPASVDSTLVGVAELAKNVGRGELPMFSF
ncbi:hypothetical protein JCM3774_003510 [Rhodotorula dairenensis]